jgi:hypothetical protein
MLDGPHALQAKTSSLLILLYCQQFHDFSRNLRKSIPITLLIAYPEPKELKTDFLYATS